MTVTFRLNFVTFAQVQGGSDPRRQAVKPSPAALLRGRQGISQSQGIGVSSDVIKVLRGSTQSSVVTSSTVLRGQQS